jgi:enterochelin esterase family protein
VAIPRLERFGYIGVYSSGLLGAFPQLSGQGRGAAPSAAPAAATSPAAAAPAAAPAPAAPQAPTAEEWEKTNAAKLENAALKKGLLLWFATGKEDRLMTTTQATVDLFKKHGFAPVFKESPGGHTWLNWRAYLAEFTPLLFKTAAKTATSPQ